MDQVYVETTIPSYYFETRTALRVRVWRDATRRWWDMHRSRYELVTSEIVIEEMKRAPAGKSADMLRLLDGVARLPNKPGVEETARFYLDHRLMPRDSLADALHVALASVHGVQFVLTWNCRHLANANKARHLAILNGRLGLPVPTITTPDLLLPEA